jgi:hypothetical protein
VFIYDDASRSMVVVEPSCDNVSIQGHFISAGEWRVGDGEGCTVHYYQSTKRERESKTRGRELMNVSACCVPALE